MTADMGACIICLDTSPPPIQSGCACRGDSGLAHIACLVQAATSQQPQQGIDVWRRCQTCTQYYTGAMQMGLAEAWRSRVAGQAAENTERLLAEGNLATSLVQQGKDAEAEPMFRRQHEVMMRMHGAEHPDTLTSAGNLAMSLLNQGKHAEAERIQREVYAVQKRVLGAEHPSTLRSANNIATSLSDQRKFADAERIQREVLGVEKRVLGAEHPNTLLTANNLAESLFHQDKHVEAERIQRAVHEVQQRVLGAEHPNTLASAANLAMSLVTKGEYAEAERIQREVHEVQKRVLGAEHPNTLMAANNQASSLFHQGKYVEAQQMLHAALASLQRVLGPSHPYALQTARNLEGVRADAARLLPAGTRVLVQRLVAKPEHNGKRARVVSFDARTGRYVVSLEDGKELSLKAECVARAGCAAAGCASDEASSVCSRCQAVWYCSRECQRTDRKAHKPVCTAAQP
jgi:tetratricopeptide (TPR) repeat protein